MRAAAVLQLRVIRDHQIALAPGAMSRPRRSAPVGEPRLQGVLLANLLAARRAILPPPPRPRVIVRPAGTREHGDELHRFGPRWRGRRPYPLVSGVAVVAVQAGGPAIDHRLLERGDVYEQDL